MKMKLTALACVLAVLPFLACDGNDKPAAATSRRAVLAATITVHGGADLRVPVAFTNPSDGVVRYPWVNGELGLLDGLLYQNGKMVKEGLVTSSKPRLKKEQVKELKSGEAATFRYRVPYTRVKPGLYELRLEYRVPAGSVLESEFGLTPMNLEQTIVLDVREE